jgi:peptide-methionine (S)-S-oxide reductase
LLNYFREKEQNTAPLRRVSATNSLNDSLQPMLFPKFAQRSLLVIVLPTAALIAIAARSTYAEHVSLPDPAMNVAIATPAGQQTAVLAGGCFWGLEAVFEHVKGVSDVVSGYSGGSASTAQYERVGTGTTGHAESVKITYDPAQITYGQLLKVYFAVAHDPTQLNRQEMDSGTQYRSAIFFQTEQQKQVALAYINQLNGSHVFKSPIVTQLALFKGFYPAEDYHQNFIQRNPNYPYVVAQDLPKLKQLQKQFPILYKP